MKLAELLNVTNLEGIVYYDEDMVVIKEEELEMITGILSYNYDVLQIGIENGFMFVIIRKEVWPNYDNNDLRIN